ncbi:MAG: general secretion pathway protein GspN [Rhizobiales bacterium]|nr:general secretion pathway protein GspN [Hyphomicrobiales bacterium]
MRIIAGLCVVGALENATFAATSPDEMKSDVDRGAIKLERDPAQAAKERVLSGNPLWAIPLGSLAITRERPIFSPSRRPLAPAVIALPPNVTQPRLVTPPAAPQRPNLTLVGTVVGTTEGFGVFLDQTTHNIVRLKTGEGHAGWILRSVKAREATLEKERQTETLRLPAPGENSPGAQKKDEQL